MELLNHGFDHVEYIVRDIDRWIPLFDRMGFEKIGSRVHSREGTRTVALAQGRVRVLLTQGDGSPASRQNHAVQFLNAQDEGICVLALEVTDARAAFEETVARGGKPAMEPQTFEAPEGRVTRAEIWTPGRVRYAFIERVQAASSSRKPGDLRVDAPALLDAGLVVSRMESPMPKGLFSIDHLTNNVGIGETAQWVKFYKETLGFMVTRHFKIKTGRTGLISDVIESPCRRVKVPINEATEPESQVQEFVDRLKGSGVQHLAFLTQDLPSTLKALRSSDFKFLTVPSTYYEAVPKRVPGVTENLKELEQLGILLDGDSSGYLLQIFSEEIMGPFFCEYIQRKGNEGFGEGNFQALFEAIERDQIKRGVL